MGDLSSNINVAEKEEGELSSDDDDDNQANIPESAHSVHTVKKYPERKVKQFSTRSKGNISDTSRNGLGDKNHRGCQKSPRGLKRRYAASDDQTQPLPKYGKSTSPGWNDLDPDDVTNVYYSSDERRPDDFRYLRGREAYESENRRSFEKVSERVKRRNTVAGDLRHTLSKRRSAARKPPSCSRSHTRSQFKSSSVKASYLTKYQKWWDQRKPSVKPEYRYRDLQIHTDDRGRKEVVRKVKERPFGQLKNGPNHGSILEGRVQERQRKLPHNRHHLVTSSLMYNDDYKVHNSYPPQDSRYPPTPSSSHRTLDLGRNPTLPINQNNGYSTLTPYTHAKPYQHPPVSLATIPRSSHRTLDLERNPTLPINQNNGYSTLTPYAHTQPYQHPPVSLATTPSISHRTLDLGRNPTLPINQNNGYSTLTPYTHAQPYQHPPVSLPTTPSSSNRTLDLERNPTLPINQNNGSSTLTPYSHTQPYQHPPVPLQTTPLQWRQHDGSLSDVIGQTLHSIRSDASMQCYSQNATFSGNIHDYKSSSVLNGPYLKLEDTASNCSSSRNLLPVVSAVSTGVFKRLGPEVENGLSDLQPGLDKKNPREPFSETAEHMCTTNTFPNRNQFPGSTVAHNTTNMLPEHQTTTPKPASGGASNRKLNDSTMQENQTKTKTATSQEKQKWKEYLSKLTVHTQQLREQVFKEIKDNFSGSSNPYEPTAVLRTQFKIDKTSKVKSMFKIDRTPKVKPKNVFKALQPSWAAVPDVFVQDVNLCNRTLEKEEQINQLDSGLPQINDKTTAKINLTPSLSEFKSEPHDEPKANETNRRHVYLSPLNMFQTYRDKQASAKGITATHDEGHVISPAQTQEENACNNHVSAMEIIETHGEGHVRNPAQTQEEKACNKQDSALEITETHEEEAFSKQDSALEITETHEEEAFSKQDSALEITETHEEEAFSKQDSALEITETHDVGHVMSPAQTQEEKACNKQDSTMEIDETHEGHVMSSTADLHEACTTQAKGNTETHNENNVMSPAETQEEEACNSQAFESAETHDQGHVMSSVAETQDVCNKHNSAMESTETHDESHVMGTAETQDEEACNKQVYALVINETQDEDHVMNSAAGTPEDGNKQDSAQEITETQDGNEAMSFAETQETCNMHVSAMEIFKTQDHVISSAADGSKQNSAKEITETRNRNHVISLAETQDEGTCNKQNMESIKTDNETCVMSSAADLQEACNKNDSAKEIIETHDKNDVMNAVGIQEEENCNKDTSATEITKIYNESRVMSFAAVVEADCNKEDSVTEIPGTHDENDMMSFGET